MKSEDNRYKCKICSDEFHLWVLLSKARAHKARAHEDAEGHVNRTQRLVCPPQPPAPLDLSARQDFSATKIPGSIHHGQLTPPRSLVSIHLLIWLSPALAEKLIPRTRYTVTLMGNGIGRPVALSRREKAP